MHNLGLTLFFILFSIANETLCASLDLAHPLNDRTFNNGIIRSYAYPDTTSLNDTCPDAEVIYPCVCSCVAEEHSIDLDCSLLMSEDQLKNVFLNLSSTVKHIRRFYMYDDQHIRVLRYGVFRNVSFNEIYMGKGYMEEVERGVLEESQETLQRMIFNDNLITKFPFEDIETFSNLRYININRNNISEISNLESSSLKELYIGHNPLVELQEDVFRGLTSIEKIELGNIGLTNIHPGIFSNLTELFAIHLDNNHLQHILSGALSGGLANLKYINLWQNDIDIVELGAVQAVEGQQLYLTFNNLELIEEDVWRPNFEAGFRMVEIGRNPLACGCDIAWLVRDPSFVDQLGEEARCANGNFIQNLNPDDFINC
ncbi:unnamed protein product [Meganyctiphanes norvegica]|uniref:Oplophorus-luciferin 2-monooxygenase non-catalytic subunit n=1 Tax=Meganyctiphanes norvegica TaxID=48144 RepID=A0AAV2S3I4_MEGNR